MKHTPADKASVLLAEKLNAEHSLGDSASWHPSNDFRRTPLVRLYATDSKFSICAIREDTHIDDTILYTGYFYNHTKALLPSCDLPPLRGQTIDEVAAQLIAAVVVNGVIEAFIAEYQQKQYEN